MNGSYRIIRCLLVLLIMGVSHMSAPAQTPPGKPKEPMQDPAKARMRVYLPTPEAQLEIQGVAIARKNSMAEYRLFESPALEAGKSYIYDVKATWTENGKPVMREKAVKVQPGQTTDVDLRVVAVDPKAADPFKPMPEKPPVEPAKPMPPEKPPVTPEKPPTPPVKPPETNFVATPKEVVDFMLKFGKVREGDVVYDIGCADGRISLAAVSQFKAARAVGIDVNADRIAAARKNALDQKFSDKLDYRSVDPTKLTEKDLADATVVTLDNMTDKQLAELAPVLKKLKLGTRVVAHNFEIAGMRYEDKREMLVNELEYTIYIYTVK